MVLKFSEMALSELGCWAGPVPPGANGRLEVSAGDGEQAWWCF